MDAMQTRYAEARIGGGWGLSRRAHLRRRRAPDGMGATRATNTKRAPHHRARSPPSHVLGRGCARAGHPSWVAGERFGRAVRGLADGCPGRRREGWCRRGGPPAADQTERRSEKVRECQRRGVDIRRGGHERRPGTCGSISPTSTKCTPNRAKCDRIKQWVGICQPSTSGYSARWRTLQWRGQRSPPGAACI